jgi:hypothetical protein
MGPEKTPKSCPICNRIGILEEKFDAYACSKCNMWLEPKCGNRDCEFCGPRPRQPQQNNQIDNRLRFLDKILGEKKYKKRDPIEGVLLPQLGNVTKR